MIHLRGRSLKDCKKKFNAQPEPVRHGEGRAFLFYSSMKTNVTLVSKSRELLGVTVRQETKTGHMNLSDLEKAYQQARSIYGWSEKGKVQDILAQKENTERVYYVLKETGFINSDFPDFMEMVENEGVLKTVKKLGCYRASGRGSNKTVWCNPYLWVLLAMELNPMLYGKTVVWLTDGLVFNRIGAADMYLELSKALSKFHDVDYKKMAQALNYIVFNKHESKIRNTGTEEQLRELERLESHLAFMIEEGYLNSFAEVINAARNIWTRKYIK